QPDQLLAPPQLRVRFLRQPEEIFQVAAPRALGLARFQQLLPSVLPDRLQHPEARRAALLLHLRQRFVDQLPQQVQHLGARAPLPPPPHPPPACPPPPPPPLQPPADTARRPNSRRSGPESRS